MHHPPGLEGIPFPVPDPDIVESCIDYWFDDDEITQITKDCPIVPAGLRAIARDPGDDLIAVDASGSVFYISHDSGTILRLSDSLEAFYSTFRQD